MRIQGEKLNAYYQHLISILVLIIYGKILSSYLKEHSGDYFLIAHQFLLPNIKNIVNVSENIANVENDSKSAVSMHII